MSSLLPVNASISYGSILHQAQKTYEESVSQLNLANGDKSLEGSIAFHIENITTQVKQTVESLKGEALPSSKEIKDQFGKYMQNQLCIYETAQSAHAAGLNAIAVIQEAQVRCMEFRPDAKLQDLLKRHLIGIGGNVALYEEKERIALEKIENYPFAAQITELTTAVVKVAAQIQLLESTLNQAFYAKKSVEGKAGLMDLLPSYGHSYLAAAVNEKSCTK